jgi:hypothetical protein
MITDAIFLALRSLLWLIPVIVAGIILAELVVQLKLVRALGFLMLPITKFGHLRTECGVSFLTAFGSPVAANSMLMEFYNNKLIDRREVIIASMITAFPAIVMHWPYMLPTLIPLIGFPGVIYFCILMLGGIIETGIVLVAGRLLLPKRNAEDTKIDKEQRPPLKEALKTSVKNARKMIKRILLIIVPCIVIVFVLMDIGVFELLETYLSGVAAYFPIPAEGLPIIAAQFAEPVVAYTIAGGLLSQGILDAKAVVLTLLIGDVLSTITILRFIIPYYLGVFGPKLGTQIMTLATSLRLIVVVMTIVVLALMW